MLSIACFDVDMKMEVEVAVTTVEGSAKLSRTKPCSQYAALKRKRGAALWACSGRWYTHASRQPNWSLCDS